VSARSVVVVGAGAVGLGCALFLQADGWDVTLIDRAEPGQQTSYGNAGILAVQSVSPINGPDVVKTLPSLLTSSTSPLRLRWRDLWATAPWLVAFLRRCTPAAGDRSARAQAALVREAGTAWRILLQRTGGGERVGWRGWLKLAEGDREAASLAGERRRLDAAGQAYAWLDGDGVAALEPALAPRFTAGLWLTDTGHVDRPGDLLRHLAGRFTAEGGRLVTDDVRDLREDGDGVVVEGAAATYRGAHAVLATGPWSAALARRLGCRVPLVAERGYHLMLPQSEAPLARPIYSARRSFVLAPMGASLRLTAGAEIARLDTAPDERPIRALLAEVRRLLPRAATEVAASWLGRRPSTPDSLPVIGPAPAAPRVVLAYGHGHLGLTLGPLTGRLVADRLAQRPDGGELAACAPGRRGGRGGVANFAKKALAWPRGSDI
jgi:D-amino-acid dehydrogenase